MGISEADVCDGSDKGGASAWGDDGKLLVGFRWGNLSARVCGGACGGAMKIGGTGRGGGSDLEAGGGGTKIS